MEADWYCIPAGTADISEKFFKRRVALDRSIETSCGGHCWSLYLSAADPAGKTGGLHSHLRPSSVKRKMATAFPFLSTVISSEFAVNAWTGPAMSSTMQRRMSPLRRVYNGVSVTRYTVPVCIWFVGRGRFFYSFITVYYKNTDVVKYLLFFLAGNNSLPPQVNISPGRIVPADMLEPIIPLMLHLDRHFSGVVHEYGMWTYLLLFAIIFLETGLVIMPFLPGDSLLFVAGAAAASGILDLRWLVVAIIAGAVLGDTVNYWIGNYIGIHIFVERFPDLVKKEYIDRTYGFYERYGGTTIFVSRFVPVVRSFAPFLAGVGSMKYYRFLFYNILGATAWTLLMVLAGYYTGTFPVVRENMGLLMIGVLVLTAGTVLFIAGNVLSSYWNRKPAAKDEK